MIWVMLGAIVFFSVPYFLNQIVASTITWGALYRMVTEVSPPIFVFYACCILGVILLWPVLIYAGVEFLNNLFYKPNIQEVSEIWKKESIQLCSLQSSTLIEGSYFIGIGGTREKRYYEILIENERGNKEYKRINADEVEIDDSLPKGKIPALVTYQKHVFNCPTNKKKCSDWLSYNWDIPVEVGTGEPYRVLEVPTGTMTTKYTIDLS